MEAEQKNKKNYPQQSRRVGEEKEKERARSYLN